MSMVWITLVVLGGLLAVVALARFALLYRPQSEMSGLPTTPLEKLGWIGLGVTTAVGFGIATLVAVVGATGFQENGAARVTFTLLMFGGIAVWSVSWYLISRRGDGAVVDERDRAILARSLSVESVVVLLSLVAWTVALTEAFWDEGALPLGYLQLVFWSTLIAGAFGRSLGIVLGYRREITVDG
jgi:hypothetical protein